MNEYVPYVTPSSLMMFSSLQPAVIGSPVFSSRRVRFLVSLSIFSTALPVHCVSALGIEPTEKEVSTAINAMANAKVMGPDGLPVELLKLGY